MIQVKFSNGSSIIFIVLNNYQKNIYFYLVIFTFNISINILIKT